MVILFHYVFPWLSVILAVTVILQLRAIDRCQQQVRDRFVEAMNFALELPIYQGRQFMRAYLADNATELRTFFPTWEER
ncbi:hypothetical protein [Rhizobium sp. L51/94]|uniref:hypothetical protein n=1 Tax=Rhizobium sp. L51/94 TaxID=2819999 RepID=UPI001C5AAFA3|nr:hypothetical protein [Rhizobium sp. L51/94]QXZ79626.1 hypothetical protein J5274_06485 [Rhizobium sp. L51/94]